MDNKILPIWRRDKVIFKNNDVPNSLRMMVIGPSSSGKTILMLRMLIYNLDFNALYLCSPSLQHQMEYKIFIESLKKNLTVKHIESIFRNQDQLGDDGNVFDLITEVSNSLSSEEKSKISVTIYKSPDELPTPEKLIELLMLQHPLKEDKKKTSRPLLIIDDSMMEKQTMISRYFVYSRPLGINVCYLTQSFFQTDKKGTRDNANLFIFFEISPLDLRNSYYHIGTREFDEYEKYKTFAEQSWSAVKDNDGKNRGYFVYNRVDKTFKANCF